MLPHHGELGLVEPRGLQEDGIGDADLAHVVEHRALDEGAHGVVVEPERLADPRGVDRDPVVVGVRVAVALGDGAADHLEHLQVRIEEVEGEPGQASHQAQDDRVEQRRGQEDRSDRERDGAQQSLAGCGLLLRGGDEHPFCPRGDAAAAVPEGNPGHHALPAAQAGGGEGRFPVAPGGREPAALRVLLHLRDVVERRVGGPRDLAQPGVEDPQVDVTAGGQRETVVDRPRDRRLDPRPVGQVPPVEPVEQDRPQGVGADQRAVLRHREHAPALVLDGQGADHDRDDRGHGEEPRHELEMQLLRLVHPQGLRAEATMDDPPGRPQYAGEAAPRGRRGTRRLPRSRGCYHPRWSAGMPER